MTRARDWLSGLVLMRLTQLIFITSKTKFESRCVVGVGFCMSLQNRHVALCA